MQSLRHLSGMFLFLAACSAGSTAMAADYSPGPVTLLHSWLEGQCSFVPDLDVGDCCALHDMAYQNPGDFEFDGATPGTEQHRRQADLAFRQCIIEHDRYIVAQIYYIGVRLFGWLFYNYQ